jgi:protein-L-isoaspartate(D-aspartate) O-methyltransferase
MEEARRRDLLALLRREGIADERVIAAMDEVPRETFVDPAFCDQSYEDTALPIDCGQTISQPYIVAMMTALLDAGPRMKVLEIGTGSGYQAAVLAKLCRRLYTIERFQKLLRRAEERFRHLDISNITTRFGDGMKGWPEQAPFDRILVTAAASQVPELLFSQLKEGGLMVVPVGEDSLKQEILRIRSQDGRMVTERLLPVRFVPLLPGTIEEGR